jgi:hypothetical protein
MIRSLLINIPLLFISVFVLAQDYDDPVDEDHTQMIIFRPGLYATFDNFIMNEPIDPQYIRYHIPHYDRDFYFELMKEKKIKILRRDSIHQVSPRSLWGYSDGKSVFINREELPKSFLERQDDNEFRWARIHLFWNTVPCSLYEAFRYTSLSQPGIWIHRSARCEQTG